MIAKKWAGLLEAAMRVMGLWAGLLASVAAQDLVAASGHPDSGMQQVLSKSVSSMNVTAGKSTLLQLPGTVGRISVGNPKVADVMLIGPSEIYILGKMIGSTNLILWMRDGQVRAVDVRVLMDTASLQEKLQEIMPEERDIQVSAAGDSLVLSGTVSNTLAVDRVVVLADAYIRTAILGMMMGMRSSGQEADGKGGAGGQQGVQVLRQGLQAGEDSPGAGAGLGSVRIVNLLRVRDNQQVMLEVKVAEVNRTIAEKLGFDFARAARKTGSAWTQVMAGVIGGGPANLLFGKNLGADVDLGLNRIDNAIMDKGTAFLMDAEKRDELIKVLAEPNIVAISGQEASFLVGGEIMIPVHSMQQTTLESKQFGIGLRFTPTVLEAGRIHLRVTPEVSELLAINPVASTGFGQVVAAPTFKTRRISTTVQLADGQSLAIGGLLQDDFQEQVKRFPMLGEVPVLGALFRSSAFQMKKTELMIVVTPRLVKPLQPDYPLPTDAFVEPSRGEFLIQGRMESASGQARPRPAGYPAGAGGFQMK